MSNARRDKTEEWDMWPRPEPDYTALAERLESFSLLLLKDAAAAIRDLQERLAQALDEIDECRIDIRTLAENKAAAERQRDDAVEALRKARTWISPAAHRSQSHE